MNSLLHRKIRRANAVVVQAMAADSSGETMTCLLNAWQDMKSERSENEFVHALIAEIILLRSSASDPP